MDPVNIVFVLALIVLPVVIGVWALFARRDLTRRGVSTRGGSTPRAMRREDLPPDTPQRDWAQHVRPVRQTSTEATIDRNRRRFYPPRYAGKSGGVVKRMSPRAERSFLRSRGSV